MSVRRTAALSLLVACGSTPVPPMPSPHESPPSVAESPAPPPDAAPEPPPSADDEVDIVFGEITAITVEGSHYMARVSVDLRDVVPLTTSWVGHFVTAKGKTLRVPKIQIVDIGSHGTVLVSFPCCVEDEQPRRIRFVRR